jgi:hypothetical protein
MERTVVPSIQLETGFWTLWAHSGRIVGALRAHGFNSKTLSADSGRIVGAWWAHFGRAGSTPNMFLDIVGASWAHSGRTMDPSVVYILGAVGAYWVPFGPWVQLQNGLWT